MRVRRHSVSAGLPRLVAVALLCVAVVGLTSGEVLVRADAAAEGYVVSLPVTVTDTSGRPVRGLIEADFSISEDGQPQTVRAFADKDIPLSLALIVDTSQSMRGPWMNETFQAVRQLVTDVLGFDDEVCMYVFGREPQLLQAWTNKDIMLESRYRVPDGAGAPLFQTLLRVSKDMEKAQHVRRVVVGVTGGSTSDGWRRTPGPAFQPPMGRAEPPSTVMSTANPWSPTEERERALKELRTRDMLFYAIGLETPRPSEKQVEPPPPIDMNELRQVSESTGGYVDLVKSTTDLSRALHRVREELRAQYLLGYVSSRGQDGKPHEVKVAVKNPEHRVRARQAYVARKR